MADLSAFIQQLQIWQTKNYLTAAGGALVAYDQVLTFSQEVDLIWATYSGCLSLIGTAVWTWCLSWTYSSFVNINLAISWTSNIFILAMQAILVIRVCALFGQSKKVLVFLATLYVLQATAAFVLTGLVVNKQVSDRYFTSIGPAIGSVMQAADVNSSAFFQTMNEDSVIVPMVFDIILLLFALWSFVKHALEAKTLDGGWSINVLVRTLVTDHLLYFICNLVWLSLSFATAYTEINDSIEFLNIVFPVFNALAVVAGPHVVISLRATENKTRGEGGTLEGEVSTIRFGIREQPESAVEEGGGFRAADESLNVQMD